MENLVAIHAVSIIETKIPYFGSITDYDLPITSSPMFYIELWRDKYQENPDREFLLSKN